MDDDLMAVVTVTLVGGPLDGQTRQVGEGFLSDGGCPHVDGVIGHRPLYAPRFANRMATWFFQQWVPWIEVYTAPPPSPAT